jgi:penicillin-binding protein 1B
VAVKVKISKNSLPVRFFLSRWGKILFFTCAAVFCAAVGVFVFYYNKYANMIDQRLRTGVFANTSVLYAAPRPVIVGEEASLKEIAGYLRRCGYSESNTSRYGWYHLRPDAIEINPGPDSFDTEGAVVKVGGSHVTQIISLRDQSERTQYSLEPELITNLFDQKREKRRIVHFNDIPKPMVNAVLSAEDKHFFQHAGFDPIGIVRAAWVDVREGRNHQGASTLTQQLARTLWLGPERGWRRKVPETFITLHLERKLSKEQIFEDYANSIYLGNQGSFSINGFGQGAQVYLGKDLSQITIAEAALLAGLPQSPGMYDPFRHAEKAKGRRNLILKAMRDNGYITEKEYDDAASSPIKVTREMVESSDAPYFVDLVNDTLQNQFSDRDFQNSSYRVYTTLDMNLQRDAVTAVRNGILETDKQWKRRNKKYGTDDFPLAQVAMVVLDAETGEVKALVGGRSYGVSQLDHVLAKRQPGSSFKPFVYATAMATGINSSGVPITPATTVIDEPTTFWFDEKPYEPSNHGNQFNGQVTLRHALAFSLNIPAVKVAEMVGYDKVSATAHAVGLTSTKATPSIALGSYEVTPLDIAGAYTVFPNRGTLVKTSFIKTIRDQKGGTVFDSKPDRKQVMDPRVSYVVLNMMQEVLCCGTGAAVRSQYRFTLPAAGKTGTSFDGWFAGFTSKLICVVWVGFDDNRDFKLEGAHSALPIWAEFMKLAHEHREYRGVHAFDAPDGIVMAQIDADTGQLAGPNCPKTRPEVFITGTQPVDLCQVHGGGRMQITGWEPTAPAPVPPPTPAIQQPPSRPVDSGERTPTRTTQVVEPRTVRSIPVTPQQPAPAPEQPKKKGFWGRIREIFKQ